MHANAFLIRGSTGVARDRFVNEVPLYDIYYTEYIPRIALVSLQSQTILSYDKRMTKQRAFFLQKRRASELGSPPTL